MPNQDAQTPQARRLQEWWLQLPLAYRVNALLYALGGAALVFLLVTLLSSDGSDNKVETGAGVTATSVATTRPATAPPTVATTSSSSSTSSSSPSTTASSATTSTTRASTNTTSGQTSTTARPVDTTTATTVPSTSATTSTTMPANCRNSTNPACGPFSWDPAPAGNLPLFTTVEPGKATYKVGEQVFFFVTVTDADHLVNDNCSEVRFDNGAAADGPCSPPPDCPDRYGPWTPPAVQPGSHKPNYINVWTTPGEHTATFRFRSWSSSRCLALDPYASEGPVVTAKVTITE